MIYEVRTYNVKPGNVPEVEKRYAEAYEVRKTLSPMAAFWHTEIGPLNQIIHVWPYQDLAERDRIRAESLKLSGWPPKIGEFLLEQKSDIFIPFAISPELKPANLGPYYEMRTYTYENGELPVLMKAWESAIEARIKVSPVGAIWYSELGGLNKFVHIWPYKTLDQRNEIRATMIATGNWPPSAKAKKEGGRAYRLLAQENKIMMPASFSPMQ
jgi:hypothetical protein